LLGLTINYQNFRAQTELDAVANGPGSSATGETKATGFGLQFGNAKVTDCGCTTKVVGKPETYPAPVSLAGRNNSKPPKNGYNQPTTPSATATALQVGAVSLSSTGTALGGQNAGSVRVVTIGHVNATQINGALALRGAFGGAGSYGGGKGGMH